jgi:preprotein translocase subunit SecG
VISVLLAQVAPAAKASAAAAQIPIQALQSLAAKYQQPQSPLQAHAPWLTHTFAGLFIVMAVALIVLLAVQTTKQEGLSGTIGGRVDSSYRGQIARVTGFIAISFVVVATLVSLSGI